MFEFDFGHFGKDEHLTHSGFLNIADRLVREAGPFARPVLLIYGDSHNFRVHAGPQARASAGRGRSLWSRPDARCRGDRRHGRSGGVRFPSDLEHCAVIHISY